MVEVQPEPVAESRGGALRLRRQRVAGRRTRRPIGSNILQKGRFGSTGGQWKLQVDGEDGDPSCVVRSDDGGPHRALPRLHRRQRVAPGGVPSRRRGRQHRGRRVGGPGARPERLGEQLLTRSRVGSPGVGDHDDQFHGRIDDVFLEIEPDS